MKPLARFILAAVFTLTAVGLIALALAGVLALADRVDAGDALATAGAILLSIATVVLIFVVLKALEREAARLERGGRW